MQKGQASRKAKISMPKSGMRGKLQARAGKGMKMKSNKSPVYKSGFDGKGRIINFLSPKTKRGTITSID